MVRKVNGVEHRVSTHSRPKAAGRRCDFQFRAVAVSTHSRPKAAGSEAHKNWKPDLVSTHSRPKAAGDDKRGWRIYLDGFNTQPPEGGWGTVSNRRKSVNCFNTQPPEGGWG